MLHENAETAPGARGRQAGFTLLEVMVVVVIVAVIGGISILGLAQADGRRNSSEAEKLQLWLQQLYDLASLEGIAYGVRQADGQLAPVVFYRQRWLPVAMPEAFTLRDNARLSWLVSPSRATERDKEAALPDLVVSAFPGEANGPLLALGFAHQDDKYEFTWDGNKGRVVVKNAGR